MEVDLAGRDVLTARAWLLGDRLDLRGVDGGVVARAPLTVSVGAGLAVLYRYGAVVVFGLEQEPERAFLESLHARVTRPFAEPEHEEADLRVAPDVPEGVGPDGSVSLQSAGVERLRTVAEVLARSALLSHYEGRLAEAVLRVEPLAERLRQGGRPRLGGRRLLAQLGDVLRTEMDMVGRAEVGEKPELTWHRPDLDHLFVLLAEEYELDDRDRALSRKLDLLARTAETLLEVLRHRSSLRLEWAIVVLIAVEIGIYLYDLFGPDRL